MGYEQVRTLLEHVETHHRRSAEGFRRLARRRTGERMAMLLSYLAQHESELTAAVQAYREEAPERVLDTWVATTGAVAALAEDLDTMTAAAGAVTEDDLLQVAMERDERVQSVYEEMTNRDAPAWVSDAFVALLEMERRHEQQLAMQAGRFADL